MSAGRGVPTPNGLLSRYLQHPDAFLRTTLRAVRHLLVTLQVWAIRCAIAATLLMACALALRMWRDRRVGRDARRLRILPPPKIDPDGALVMWMGLHALLRPALARLITGQPHLAWEISVASGEAEVSLWVPGDVPPGLVERAVESAWPGARTQPVEVLLPEVPGYTAACELALMEPDEFPLGEGVGDDPLRLVLGALSLLGPSEDAVIQVLARPATTRGRYRLRRDARRLRHNQNARILSGNRGARPSGPADPTVEADVRSILEKASSPLYEAVVRIAVTSPERRIARGKIHALAGAFAVFDGRNSFTRRRLHGGIRSLRSRSLRRGYLLSAPELARLANLPSAEALPSLDRARARTLAAPRLLPHTGKILGHSDHPGHERVVAISPEDAHHHIHLIGETGTGKSTLIARMVLDDAAAGRAAVVIDPKGDLVEAIIERLPKDALERVCLIDPDDREHAVGLNVFEGGDEDPDLVVDHVVGVFRRIYEPWWGPRTDDIMRAACLTLTQIPGSTLAEVPMLLLSADWRAQLLTAKALDRVAGVRLFWDWYDHLQEGQRAQHVAPLMNKLRGFLMRGAVRAIVGQPEPRLDIPRLLDEGGLLLVRIPKGTIGEETSRLLGAFVVARVWQAAMKRASRPEAERQSVAMYVDEMHNYLALPRSFEDMLAEARGYRLSLVLAHQHMGQLPKGMREALAANARTKIAFTCSPEDSQVLERQFAPFLAAHDLASLDAFQAACRPCVGGAHGSAFTFRTEAPQDRIAGRATAVRKASAAAYAQPRGAVENEIRRRHAQIESIRSVGSRAAGDWGSRSVSQSVSQPGSPLRLGDPSTREHTGDSPRE